MGNCLSFHDIYDDEQMASWRDQFEALKLTKREIAKLRRVFRQVDIDNSGTIGLPELLALMDVERTAFSERVFSIFDEDGSGAIDFKEFVLALWNYCTLSPATLDLFAFDLYDKDSSGVLSIEEIEIMMKDIYGKKFLTNTHAKSISHALKALDSKQDVDPETFCQFAKTHHALLFPAFEMQLYLQRSTLGLRFWQHNADRRIELSKGRFVPVGKFMELHLNKNLYHQTVSGAVTKMSKGVEEDALLLLATTGTRHGRNENSNHSQFVEDDHGHVHMKPKPAPSVRQTQEERFVEHNTKDVAQIYKDISAATNTKILNSDKIPRISSKDSMDENSGRNGTNANGKSLGISIPHGHAKVAMDPATGNRLRTDSGHSSDGNPSVNLAIMSDLHVDTKPKPKVHNKGRRSTLPGPHVDNHDEIMLKHKPQPLTGNDPKTLNKLHKDAENSKRRSSVQEHHSGGHNSSNQKVSPHKGDHGHGTPRKNDHNKSDHSIHKSDHNSSSGGHGSPHKGDHHNHHSNTRNGRIDDSHNSDHSHSNHKLDKNAAKEAMSLNALVAANSHNNNHNSSGHSIGLNSTNGSNGSNGTHSNSNSAHNSPNKNIHDFSMNGMINKREEGSPARERSHRSSHSHGGHNVNRTYSSDEERSIHSNTGTQRII